MTVQMLEKTDAKTLTIKVSDKLTKEDYETFAPRVEEKIREHGKIRVLFDMEDFHGWKASALWEDIKFDVKHFNDIEKLAMVGDKSWQEGMAKFCRPFTTAKVKFFERDQLDEAHQWLATD